jgi:hypothetical protein
MVIILTLTSVAVQISKYYFGHGRLYGLVDEFDADLEGNIPTWYASSSLLICSILLALIAIDKKIKRGNYIVHWAFLSIIFLLMSLDEAASIHELSIIPLRDALGVGSFLYLSWVIPGIASVVIFLILYMKFFRDLPRSTQPLFLVSAFLYIFGAIGMEMIGGYYSEMHGLRSDITYMIIANLEEFFEMAGIAVFIYALLTYMSSQVSELEIHIEK